MNFHIALTIMAVIAPIVFITAVIEVMPNAYIDPAVKEISRGILLIGAFLAGFFFIFYAGDLQQLTSKPKTETSTKIDKTGIVTKAVSTYQTSHANEKLTKFSAKANSVTLPDNVTHVIYVNDAGKTVSGDKSETANALNSKHGFYVFSE